MADVLHEAITIINEIQLTNKKKKRRKNKKEVSSSKAKEIRHEGVRTIKASRLIITLLAAVIVVLGDVEVLYEIEDKRKERIGELNSSFWSVSKQQLAYCNFES